MDVPVVGAVIDSIVGSSVENLISLLKNEFSLITGVEKDVEKLVSVLSTIQAVLEDAEENQIDNIPISNWLRKLKDEAYDAEVVLEAWALKIQDRIQMEAATTSSTSLVSRCLPSSLNPKNISFRRKIAKQIQKVISKFNEIADEQKFHLKTGFVIQHTSESQYRKDRRETSLVATEPHSLVATEPPILAILRLSYNHLSSRLKQCFAYCAIFPKDSVMKKSQLINSWIANGFIQCQGNMELEEVGDDVFNELLRLSFFREPETDPFFKTTICKMHDLMHDLASGVAKNECFIAKIGETKDIPKTILHLSVVCDSQESQTDVVDHLLSPPLSLRTLSFFHSIDFHRFQFSSTLRVLNLSNRYIETLPPSICDLIHLRYLDLSFNSLVSLPESIHNLRNLLMLDLSDNRELGALPLSLCKLLCLSYLNLSSCHSITSLPEGLGSMSSLRHLHNRDCYREMPVGIGQLTCLKTLGWFVVGRPSDGDNGGGGARISELQGMNQLRGELNIRGLENVRNGEDAKEADLSSKTHLTRLQLCWDPEEDVNGNSEEVLEGLLWLPLNNNITNLEIWYYKGACFSEVLLQNLKSLKSLEIRWCGELVSLPEGLLQNLTSLEKLEIEYCYRLKSLGFKGTQRDSNPNTFSSSSTSSSSHFYSSSLQKLVIWNCPQLLLSEEDFKNLDALRELTLNDLPQLTALPQGIQHLPMFRRLRIRKCSNLRILPEWTKGREKEKGEDSNIEFGPEEEDANEPATKETTYQVNNDEYTIIELDGSATEPISDNPN